MARSFREASELHDLTKTLQRGERIHLYSLLFMLVNGNFSKSHIVASSPSVNPYQSVT